MSKIKRKSLKGKKSEKEILHIYLNTYKIGIYLFSKIIIVQDLLNIFPWQFKTYRAKLV